MKRCVLHEKTIEYLVESELDRNRIERRDAIRDIVSNPKCLVLCLARKVYKQRVCIAVYHFCTPLLGGVNETNSLYGDQ
jgi:hypothetical protein